MSRPSEPTQRDPKDDAAAREWARQTREALEAGLLTDDSDAIAERLDGEKEKRTPSR